MALGRTFRAGGALFQVIGVSRHSPRLADRDQARAFYRLLQQPLPTAALLLRSREPQTLANAIRRTVDAEDSRVSVVDIRTMESVLDATPVCRRLAAEILVLGRGLLLAAAGLRSDCSPRVV